MRPAGMRGDKLDCDGACEQGRHRPLLRSPGWSVEADPRPSLRAAADREPRSISRIAEVIPADSVTASPSPSPSWPMWVRPREDEQVIRFCKAGWFAEDLQRASRSPPRLDWPKAGRGCTWIGSDTRLVRSTWPRSWRASPLPDAGGGRRPRHSSTRPRSAGARSTPSSVPAWWRLRRRGERVRRGRFPEKPAPDRRGRVRLVGHRHRGSPARPCGGPGDGVSANHAERPATRDLPDALAEARATAPWWSSSPTSRSPRGGAGGHLCAHHRASRRTPPSARYREPAGPATLIDGPFARRCAAHVQRRCSPRWRPTSSRGAEWVYLPGRRRG